MRKDQLVDVVSSSSKQHARSPRRKWRRYAATAVGVPLLVLAFFSASLAYRIYANNRAADGIHLKALTLGSSPVSILVFSPHPDDETLGTGGLLSEAIRHGYGVHVTFLTCGDAFRLGAAHQFSTLHIVPSDFIRYGSIRRQEALNALSHYGIHQGQVEFLGFPDQGLMSIWEDHWLAQDPFQSSTTHAHAVPYSFAVSPGQPYCGKKLLADIVGQLERYRPTDVFVTHPNDDHSDHSAGAAFVSAAVCLVKESGAPWTSHMRLHYFLVHRGDWPVPQGLDEDSALAPPAPLLSVDTSWSSLSLPIVIEKLKFEALKCYQSQLSMTGRFLMSFVRRNEIFGRFDNPRQELAVVSRQRMRLDGDAAVWAGIEPVAKDPVGDTILRDFQPGADLTNLWACRDDKLLYLRLSTRGALVPGVIYRLYVRSVGAGGVSRDQAFDVTFAGQSVPAGQIDPLAHAVSAVWQGNSLEVAIPRSEIQIADQQFICIGAETRISTRLGQIIVDKTGFRCVWTDKTPTHRPQIASRPDQAPRALRSRI